ncbi:hypothetical protein [Corynebacterium diphtheriae]|uniref:hypothetical protein n=1 Tax=Corynebacterium diphtheriae TaxID=1717 RepID=UPI00030BCFA6|nr:hypothetical protein [Corynebacterium diphtheriae]OJI02358.1 hypothetical protein BKD75_08385 [Corynebacterium diphtheriae]VEJ65413.1 putative secreted protein [Corynebacterium diphtheriae]
MKLNKRVIASVALSVSLVATAVIQAAWAADEHVTCTQNFRAGVDIDAAINLNVAKHLQRNRNWGWRQIAGLNVEQMGQLAKKLLKEDGTPLHSEEALKPLEPDRVGELAKYKSTFVSNDRKGSAGEEQQSGPPLSMNQVKAGDRKITGSVFLLPGQQKTVQVIFPNGLGPTQDLQFNQSSAESGDNSRGKTVLFKIAVPPETELHPSDVIAVIHLYDNYVKSKPKPVKVVVKSADNGQAPGGGAGEGSSNFGNIFGVIAGLSGLAAVVAGVAKIFNQYSGFSQLLQPLRNFLAQFNIKF